MDIYCCNCNKYFNKDRKENGKIVEEYINVYGTFCPFCNKLVESDKKKDINKENDLKIELLREEMRNRLRQKFRR